MTTNPRNDIAVARLGRARTERDPGAAACFVTGKGCPGCDDAGCSLCSSLTPARGSALGTIAPPMSDPDEDDSTTT